MKVAILIAARMKSTRLPKKCMKDIQGQPMIDHLIDRMKTSKVADEIVLCTSTHPDDNVLIDRAIKKGINHVMGSENDVMERFLEGAKKVSADIIIRVTGDNPLTSPYFIDNAVNEHILNKADYTRTTELPQGTKGEVISVSALERAYALAEDSSHSEYMTWYFTDNPGFFKTQNLSVDENLKRSQYRLTVDTPEDFELISRIYKELYKPGQIIPLADAIRFLDENPELLKINANIKSRDVYVRDRVNVKLRSE